MQAAARGAVGRRSRNRLTARLSLRRRADGRADPENYAVSIPAWPASTKLARHAAAPISSVPRGYGRNVAGEFDDIRVRLETISEELADLAIMRLRESIDAGGAELPVDERRLTRARRAVERAIAVLREPDDDV